MLCAKVTLSVLLSLFLLLVLALSPITTFRASLGNITFKTTWGGVGNDSASHIISDSAGNVFAGGQTNSFATGNYNALLMKFASNGSVSWAKIWGQNTSDAIVDTIANDSAGNIFAVGALEPRGGFGGGYGPGCQTWGGYGICSLIVLKFDSEGNLLWQKAAGGNMSSFGIPAAVDSAGNLYISGYTLDPTSGRMNVPVLKFNSTGSFVWQRSISGTGNQLADGIAIDSAGNVYLTGYTKSGLDPSGDAFIAKLNGTGSLLWVKSWGGSGFDQGWAMNTDSSGNLYMTGRTASFSPNSVLMLLKFNSTGGLVWERLWGVGQGGNVGLGIAFDNSSNVWITGGTGPSSSDQTTWDALIMEVSPEGNLLAQKSWGGNGYDTSQSLTVTPSGQIIFGGWVTEAPPYTLTTLNKTFVPAFYSAVPISLNVTSLNLNLTDLHGITQTVTGSTAYYGGYDVAIFGYNPNLAASSTIPSAPRGLTAAPAIGRISLIWQPPTSNGGSPITNYTIYRGTTPGGETLLKILANQTSYDDISIISGATLYYKVTANNSIGQSATSNEVSTAPNILPTLPLLPVSITISALSALVIERFVVTSRRCRGLSRN